MYYNKQIQKYNDAFHQMKEMDRKIKNSGELTPGELSLIVAIGRKTGDSQGVKSTELSKALKVTPAAVSKMLMILENKMLIRRGNDPEDRRAVYIRLTDLGNDIFLEFIGEQEDLLVDVFKKMGQEKTDTFLDLMHEFNQIIAEEHLKVTQAKTNPRNTMFIENIDFSFTTKDILTKMGMTGNNLLDSSLSSIKKVVLEIAKPKGFFMEMKVEKCTEKSLSFGGQNFFTPSLANKFTKGDTIYPFLCTCGKELTEYGKTIDDILEQYVFDVIMEMYQVEIAKALMKNLSAKLQPCERIISASPGSLADWAIHEQKKLFYVFGENAKRAGVSLNSSALMYPVKSVSGVYFIAHDSCEELHHCEICQRKNCPDRTANFDAQIEIAPSYR